jgi:hypothetical protein
MGPDLVGRLAGLGIDVTARLEVQGTVVRVHLERIRLGRVPVPASLVLGYVRGRLEGRPGIAVEAGGRTISLDLNRMGLFGPDLALKSLRLDRGRVTVRVGPAGEEGGR